MDNILIEPGLLKKIPALLKQKKIGYRYAIISDAKVADLYSKKLLKDLRAAGLKAELLTFPSGEKQKNLQTVEKLLDTLAKKDFTRSDAVIAVGGGVTGDIAGFVAAIFMRGIPCIQVPTTLLAMADSGIGGKTGVNLLNGKNLAGTFTQPSAVYIDVQTTKTLSMQQLRNGMSEIVKNAIIMDPKLFETLDDNPKKFFQRDLSFLNKIIIQSSKNKASVIEKDEKEKGPRMILNFGHTVGHALEKVSDYKIPHGQAVAVGMKIMNEIGHRKSLTNPKDYMRIKNLINKYSLDEGFDAELISRKNLDRVWSIIRSDKKRKGSAIRFVIVPKIGKATLYEKITKADIIGAASGY